MSNEIIDEDWETPCPVQDDGVHCVCWYDGDPCCSCGAPALPPGHPGWDGEK